MTDAEYEAQIKRIQVLAARWIKPLGLGWWNVDLVYCRDGLSVPNPEDAANNWQCLARTEVKWEYLDATIRFNMPAVAERDDEDLESVFVHELIHIFVNEMRHWSDENGMMHEERVVTHLAKAILWLRDHAKHEGERSAQLAIRRKNGVKRAAAPRKQRAQGRKKK